MIIKKINIIAFGGIKNRIIDFTDGLNIIYGENETGKSTIQNFIKVWLYGFSNSRVKNLSSNERIKYAPLSGENISGELYIQDNNKEYIITRTFGKTKKDDTAKIINALTGEELLNVDPFESGKYFLGVNRSTFSKTLFIGQLDVEVKKDKEEEIIDKISSVVGVGEGDITVDKAIGKLEGIKKSLSNSRNTGDLDKTKEKLSILIDERYDAYKLSQQCLENEEELIKLKNDKTTINEEIANLEIYKKYMKRSKLKKEYNELTSYLSKKVELEEKEKSIIKDITFNDEIVTHDFINNLKEEYNLFDNLVKMREEDIIKLSEDKEELKILNDKYKIEDNEHIHKSPSVNIEALKVEQQMLREKINVVRKLNKEIKALNGKKVQAIECIEGAYKLKDIANDVNDTLTLYEKSLNELKSLAEGSKEKTTKKIIILAAVILVVFSAIGMVLFRSQILKLATVISSVVLLVFYILSSKINNKSNGSRVKKLKRNIGSIEEKLNEYMRQINVNNYKELYSKLNLYFQYKELEEKINLKIIEKKAQIKLFNDDDVLEKYASNEKIISDLLIKYSCSNIDELVNNFNKYTVYEKEANLINVKIHGKEENLNKINEQIRIRENTIYKRLESIGKGYIDIEEVANVINELSEKLKLREEIHRSLLSIEETYTALSKDKDMDQIKDELKGIVNMDFKYSYEKEEEIDDAIREKTKILLDMEKRIKDVENEIKNRFIGKRNIPNIEEEINDIKNKISNDEKKYNASDLALKLIKESYDELRDSFGNILNNNVSDIYREFTAEKYNSVMVSDKYEMKLQGNNTIFSADYLSNGANDQLYLSLRLAIINMIYKNKDITLFLDDAFVQYDDIRVERIMNYLVKENFQQNLLFTCQKRESSILNLLKIRYNYIEL